MLVLLFLLWLPFLLHFMVKIMDYHPYHEVWSKLYFTCLVVLLSPKVGLIIESYGKETRISKLLYPTCNLYKSYS